MRKTKSRSIYRMLLTPSLLILLLFPLLACGIFYVSASHFASKEAEERLTELREVVLPVMDEMFEQDDEDISKVRVRRFARKILRITRQIKGDTRLMIFVTRKNNLVYPRDENEQISVQPEVQAFSTYIEEKYSEVQSRFALEQSGADDTATGHTYVTPVASETQSTTTNAASVDSAGNVLKERNALKKLDPELFAKLETTFETAEKIRTSDGEEYLVSIYPKHISEAQDGFIITYCPVADIDAWVARASVLVLLISLASAIVLIAIQRHTAERITKQFETLAAEAERIGSGDFTPIARDFSIEELVELSTSMNHMSTMLRGARESEKKFYQNVSHDLRTPLMSIGGYAQGIETGIMADYMHAAHIISEESAWLTQYVSDLLTLSRLETGEKFQLERLDLADCIEESFEHMNGLALKNGVELKVEMPQRELLVEADAAQLVRILDNLVSNAVRYAHHTVWIQVEDARDDVRGGDISLHVVDDGDGIRESELPHIFERSYKGEKGGFGFGLAIASNAARNMNATLDAGNRPEGGAEFTLRFGAGWIS